MKKTIRILAVAALSAVALSANAIERNKLVSYAQSLKGKNKGELKTAICNLIGKANVLSYGSGSNGTWWGFYVTDKDADGYVIDRYSNEKRKFTSRGSAPGGMNIEHSFAKSWWGGSSNQAYKDLYNLMPSDERANSSKGSFGMGVVTGNPSYDNGCIKIGNGTQGFKVWEPKAEWKGDFARSYMYMATTYQNLTWQGTEALKSLDNNKYPTFKSWASKLYLEWTRTDKVTQLEVDRNNAVADIQGNRNLYVDFPTLAEYVWGDSVNVAFDPAVALTTASDDSRYASYTPSTGGGTVDPNPDPTDPTDPVNPGVDPNNPITPQEGIILNDSFDTITEGNSSESSGSSKPWEGDDQFTTADNCYQAGGAVRVGSSKKIGSMTSAPIKFDGGKLTVQIDVKGWTTIEGSLEVSLTGCGKKTIEYSAKMADPFQTVSVTFENVPANPQLTIATSAKRAFVDNVKAWDPTATAIPSVSIVPQFAKNVFYTISGQQLNTTWDNLPNGLYIYNGKKVVKK